MISERRTLRLSAAKDRARGSGGERRVPQAERREGTGTKRAERVLRRDISAYMPVYAHVNVLD